MYKLIDFTVFPTLTLGFFATDSRELLLYADFNNATLDKKHIVKQFFIALGGFAIIFGLFYAIFSEKTHQKYL